MATTKCPTIPHKPTPDASQNSAWSWKTFLVKIGVAFTALQILFLGNMCYFYGSVFRASNRYQRFNVLMVDFDGGPIGQSMINTYEELKGPSFPTCSQKTPSQYPTPDSLYQAVRHGHYWAAIYTTPGASSRLMNTLQSGGNGTAYNASDAMIYIWDEARYSPISDSVFKGSFQALVSATRLTYNALYGSSALNATSRTDPAAIQALLNPISGTSLNIQTTEQTTKILYNTVSIVVPILSQFFFVMALNNICTAHNIYRNKSFTTNAVVRGILSLLYTLLAALTMAGYIWAFKESWSVTPAQFLLTWIALWLFMHINFLLFDAASSVLPTPAMPFVVFTWIIINVTSAVSPLELNPGFYRWSYALPAHEAYTVLQDIWTGGAVPRLGRALPVLFSWWVVGWGGAGAGLWSRVRMARRGDVEGISIGAQGDDDGEGGGGDEEEVKGELKGFEPPTGLQSNASDEEDGMGRSMSEGSSDGCLDLEGLPTLEDMGLRPVPKSAASV